MQSGGQCGETVGSYEGGEVMCFVVVGAILLLLIWLEMGPRGPRNSDGGF